MATFRCTASKANGDLVRCLVEAPDRNGVLYQLQQHGLFLISCVEVEEPPPGPPQASGPDPASLSRPDDGIRISPHLTRPQKFALASILLTGIVIGAGQAYYQRRPLSESAVVTERLTHLRVDMTRGEVEKYLGKPEFNRDSPSRSYYAIPPHFLIEVQFNETNGRGHETNRVTSSEFKVLRTTPS